jgi:uncharacterized protein YkwD
MKQLLIILSIFYSLYARSQLPTDSIKGDKDINITYLEKLTLEEINKYRVSKGIPKLIISESACESCKRHNEWMYCENKFEHSHDNCYENLLIIPLYAHTTYIKMAKEIINSWKESMPHNKNLLTMYAVNFGIGIKKEELMNRPDDYCLLCTLQLY